MNIVGGKGEGLGGGRGPTKSCSKGGGGNGAVRGGERKALRTGGRKKSCLGAKLKRSPKPSATTSSTPGEVKSRSLIITFVVTHHSRQTLATSLSRGHPRPANTPDRAQVARWWPQESSGRDTPRDNLSGGKQNGTKKANTIGQNNDSGGGKTKSGTQRRHAVKTTLLKRLLKRPFETPFGNPFSKPPLENPSRPALTPFHTPLETPLDTFPLTWRTPRKVILTHVCVKLLVRLCGSILGPFWVHCLNVDVS